MINEDKELGQRHPGQLVSRMMLDPQSKRKGSVYGFGGGTYNIEDFTIDMDITVNVVAKSLSKQCRYVGNWMGDDFFSVAQHCVMMANHGLLSGDPVFAMALLMHDAGECLTGDLSSPFKKIIDRASDGKVKEIEDTMTDVLLHHMGMSDISLYLRQYHKKIKEVDINMAHFEMTLMHRNSPSGFDFWSPKKAEEQFLFYHDIIHEFIQNQKLHENQ